MPAPDDAEPPLQIGDVVLLAATVRAVVGGEVFLETPGGHKFWVGIKDIVSSPINSQDGA